MERKNLITKEKQKQAYLGKLKHDWDWSYYGGSINDDLESLVTRLQDHNLTKNETAYSFFLPKLTDAELKLVQQKDEKHLDSYAHAYPDINTEEMKKSDSRDKYVHCVCSRMTRVLTLDSAPTAKRRQKH